MSLEQTEGFATIVGIIITGVLNYMASRKHDVKLDNVQKMVDGPLGDALRTNAIYARRWSDSSKNPVDVKEAERLEALSAEHDSKMAASGSPVTIAKPMI